MKRVIVVCLLFFTCEFHICAQQEWNQTYELYDAKIVDTYYDYENSTQWVLVIGVSKEDMKYNLNHESPLNTLLLVNLKTGGKTIIPNYFVLDNMSSGGILTSETLNAFFSMGTGRGEPKTIYCTLPMSATDSGVLRYDLEKKHYTYIHAGWLHKVLPSGNLLITYTGFEVDYKGYGIPGRGNFDIVVQPDGTILWESNYRPQ